MTNHPFQLIVVSVSEGACTAPITFEQSQQPKHNLVDHYEVIGRANLIDPIKFVGYNGQISLISLKLIGINGLVVKCNGLFDFIGIFGIDRLVGIVDLSCLDDLIGLVDLVEIPTPEWPPALGQPSASMAGKVHTRVAPSLGAAISLDGGKVHTRVAIDVPNLGATQPC
jgi:hypothetical protein